MSSRLILVTGALGLFTLIALACGSSADDSDFGSSGSSGSSGASGASGSNGNVFGEAGGGDGSSGSSGSSGDGASCLAPVDMFVMFDRSGSMNEPLDDNNSKGDCNIGQTIGSKWCRSINALSGYFNGAGATGQGAALQFFPVANHSTGLCTTGDVYNVPVMPPAATVYQTLPSNAFDALLNSTVPGGGGSSGTPTEGAIRGLTRFTAANRRPGKVTIGILITDGDPNGCNTDLKDLSDLLQAHNTATKVRTYVIGMQGASFDKLETIAAGGNSPMHPDTVGALMDACGNGNGPCRHWNVGDGNPAAFTAALAAIQESADGCKPGGGEINPGPK